MAAELVWALPLAAEKALNTVSKTDAAGKTVVVTVVEPEIFEKLRAADGVDEEDFRNKLVQPLGGGKTSEITKSSSRCRTLC